MKILELRFKNLNSLYGEWIIDFTTPEYTAGGIFALTGPTGAGKSTILDAICLALYGATPRLGRITKSSNEIMSQMTGECYAEVLFASQAGRFRCHWQQRRARKKAGAKLQDQQHQIADAATGKPVETRKSRVVAIIEEKTGMDFDRFTRSILLAQGGFDTFLKADIEQKSKILEQITGTEIYSEISRRVHQRQRDEREKLNVLRAEISGITMLSPQQEEEIVQELEEKQKQESVATGQAKETGDAINWLKSIAQLKKELHELGDKSVRLKADIDAFKPEQARLERAVAAASLDGIYAAVITLRQQQLNEQVMLKEAQGTLPRFQAMVKKNAEALQVAEQFTLERKKELAAAAPLIQKVRALDQQIGEQARAVAEAAASCKRETAEIEKEKRRQRAKQQKRDDSAKALAAVAQYLADHARDEWLVSGLAGIKQQFADLLSRQQEINAKAASCKNAETALEKSVKALDLAAEQRSVCAGQLKTAGKDLQQGKEKLNRLLNGKLLREYRADKEGLLREMSYIKEIARLEDYRTRLEDGKPCPLCGSTGHPYAEGNIPAADKVEQQIESLDRLIAAAEQQEVVIRQLEQAEIAVRDKCNNSEKLESSAAGEKTLAEKTVIQLKDDLAKLQTIFARGKQEIAEKLSPFGYDIDVTDLSATLCRLQSSMEKWQQQSGRKAEIDKELSGIDSEIRRIDAVIDTRVKVLDEREKSLALLKREHLAATESRKKLYGDKVPEEEERQLSKAVTDAEGREKEARALYGNLQEKLTAATARIDSLHQSIKKRVPELQKNEMDFSAAMGRAGFAAEALFLQARLPDKEREALSLQARRLDSRATELKATKEEREKRLAAEDARKLTTKTLEELEPQAVAIEESLQQLRQRIAGCKHALDENRAARKRTMEKQAAIDAQQQECARFDKLHGLIGSADGKKYRNFAQGLTFELMVSHANRQLEKMTDRYLLVRDSQQPLELNVIDNYQAGEIRSTRNLSGGESFIVSLTLALGLSKMASRKVRVDSLFLDEGFGTLDEEALEIALETLSGLQQDGKLIGVISHVSALKERIGTQINITPLSGGRSAVTGPGCSRPG